MFKTRFLNVMVLVIFVISTYQDSLFALALPSHISENRDWIKESKYVEIPKSQEDIISNMRKIIARGNEIILNGQQGEDLTFSAIMVDLLEKYLRGAISEEEKEEFEENQKKFYEVFGELSRLITGKNQLTKKQILKIRIKAGARFVREDLFLDVIEKKLDKKKQKELEGEIKQLEKEVKQAKLLGIKIVKELGRKKANATIDIKDNLVITYRMLRALHIVSGAFGVEYRDKIIQELIRKVINKEEGMQADFKEFVEKILAKIEEVYEQKQYLGKAGIQILLRIFFHRLYKSEEISDRDVVALDEDETHIEDGMFDAFLGNINVIIESIWGIWEKERFIIKTAVTYFIYILNSRDIRFELKHIISYALIKLGNIEGVQYLLREIQDKKNDLVRRRNAASLFGLTGNVRGIDYLTLEMQTSSDYEVRISAAQALNTIGNERGQKGKNYLFGVLNDGGVKLKERMAVAEALAKLNESKGYNFLRGIIMKDKPYLIEQKIEAAEALGRLNDIRGESFLANIMENLDIAVKCRRLASKSLINIRGGLSQLDSKELMLVILSQYKEEDIIKECRKRGDDMRIYLQQNLLDKNIDIRIKEKAFDLLEEIFGFEGLTDNELRLLFNLNYKLDIVLHAFSRRSAKIVGILVDIIKDEKIRKNIREMVLRTLKIISMQTLSIDQLKLLLINNILFEDVANEYIRRGETALDELVKIVEDKKWNEDIRSRGIKIITRFNDKKIVLKKLFIILRNTKIQSLKLKRLIMQELKKIPLQLTTDLELKYLIIIGYNKDEVIKECQRRGAGIVDILFEILEESKLEIVKSVVVEAIVAIEGVLESLDMEKIVILIKTSEAKKILVTECVRRGKKIKKQLVKMMLNRSLNVEVKNVVTEIFTTMGDTAWLEDLSLINESMVVEGQLQTTSHQKNGVEIVRNALTHQDWTVREAGVDLLVRFKFSDVLSLLNIALKDEHWVVRRALAEVLGKMDDDGAVNLLFILLDDKSQIVREFAFDALLNQAKTRDINLFIEGLKDKNINIRKAVIRLLGEIGGKRVVEVLKKQLKVWNLGIRRVARIALGKMGYVKVKAKLQKYANSQKVKYADIKEEAELVLKALANIEKIVSTKEGFVRNAKKAKHKPQRIEELYKAMVLLQSAISAYPKWGYLYEMFYEIKEQILKIMKKCDTEIKNWVNKQLTVWDDMAKMIQPENLEYAEEINLLQKEAEKKGLAGVSIVNDEMMKWGELVLGDLDRRGVVVFDKRQVIVTKDMLEILKRTGKYLGKEYLGRIIQLLLNNSEEEELRIFLEEIVPKIKDMIYATSYFENSQKYAEMKLKIMSDEDINKNVFLVSKRTGKNEFILVKLLADGMVIREVHDAKTNKIKIREILKPPFECYSYNAGCILRLVVLFLLKVIPKTLKIDLDTMRKMLKVVIFDESALVLDGRINIKYISHIKNAV